jgi:hypothetical protein
MSFIQSVAHYQALRYLLDEKGVPQRIPTLEFFPENDQPLVQALSQLRELHLLRWVVNEGYELTEEGIKALDEPFPGPLSLDKALQVLDNPPDFDDYYRDGNPYDPDDNGDYEHGYDQGLETGLCWARGVVARITEV